MMTAADPAYDSIDDAELNRQLMPRIAVPDHEHWLVGDLALSQALMSRLEHQPDLRYGPGPLQVLDVFPAPDPAGPILLFFHGGYWRGLSKDYINFLAGPLTEAGICVVTADYDLCPAVTLATIVEQAAEALRWVRSNSAKIKGDPEQIYVAGNSAGAHLAAMLLARDWSAEGLEKDLIKGACLITGIYDLRPILRIQVNEDARLSLEEALKLSPLFLPVHGEPRCVIAVGGAEPPLWIEQSTRYGVKLRELGLWAETMITPRLHHFSITRSLSDADSPLTRAMIELMR